MSPRRVLVSVEPRVLAEALGATLRQAGDEVVVVATDAVRGDEGWFDAAIVTATSAGDLPARVTVILPDALGNGGRGRVSSADGVTELDMGTSADVLGILDRLAPQDDR